MNPFEQSARPLEQCLLDWRDMWPLPYDKHSVDPYTRARVILMNSVEFDNVAFSHQMARACADRDVRRALALMRRSEQQQQKVLAALKPANETQLEHTIGYEQLSVDLTAHLALREMDDRVRDALHFALLEDLDHLYRFSVFLDLETGVRAESIVGGYTEIMPGRPTIAHHRAPGDSILSPLGNDASLFSRMAALVISAAEQQAMNYYMNVCATYPNDPGRALYREIGMVEEEHVSRYESLMDPSLSWAENLLMRQYAECYLYWSMARTETDPTLRQTWKRMTDLELSHLRLAQTLLERLEGKTYDEVVGDGVFPAPIKLGSNIGYVRDVLGAGVNLTARGEGYAPVESLAADADFFRYQALVNADPQQVQSHGVVQRYIDRFGEDYRFEIAPSPVPALRERRKDNISLARQGPSSGC